jgi:uncharacterized SAM-binding protein YcdF (DUF218 family)
MTISDRERFLVSLAYTSPSNADVIVCLAGEEGDNRAFAAAELFKMGKAPGILVTGGRHEPPTHIGATLLTTLILGRGIAHDRILADDGPQNTREQAEAVINQAAKRNWRRLILVASSWHIARAYLTFLAALQEAGVTDVCLVPAAVQSPAFADRLDGELAKIDAYGPHCASYADGLAELARWAR